ncbi:MAG: hypothetical protein MJZ25_03940 [Fibrobacter sp.]|nr:hypothetical protein [Fibrobacter sp.]
MKDNTLQKLIVGSTRSCGDEITIEGYDPQYHASIRSIMESVDQKKLNIVIDECDDASNPGFRITAVNESTDMVNVIRNILEAESSVVSVSQEDINAGKEKLARLKDSIAKAEAKELNLDTAKKLNMEFTPAIHKALYTTLNHGDSEAHDISNEITTLYNQKWAPLYRQITDTTPSKQTSIQAVKQEIISIKNEVDNNALNEPEAESKIEDIVNNQSSDSSKKTILAALSKLAKKASEKASNTKSKFGTVLQNVVAKFNQNDADELDYNTNDDGVTAKDFIDSVQDTIKAIDYAKNTDDLDNYVSNLELQSWEAEAKKTDNVDLQQAIDKVKAAIEQKHNKFVAKEGKQANIANIRLDDPQDDTVDAETKQTAGGNAQSEQANQQEDQSFKQMVEQLGNKIETHEGSSEDQIDQDFIDSFNAKADQIVGEISQKVHTEEQLKDAIEGFKNLNKIISEEGAYAPMNPALQKINGAIQQKSADLNKANNNPQDQKAAEPKVDEITPTEETPEELVKPTDDTPAEENPVEPKVNETKPTEGKIPEETVKPAGDKPAEETKVAETKEPAKKEEPVNIEPPASSEQPAPEKAYEPNEFDETYPAISKAIKRMSAGNVDTMNDLRDKIQNSKVLENDEWKNATNNFTDSALVAQKLIPTIAKHFGITLNRSVDNEGNLHEESSSQTVKHGRFVVPQGWNKQPEDYGQAAVVTQFGLPMLNLDSETIKDLNREDFDKDLMKDFIKEYHPTAIANALGTGKGKAHQRLMAILQCKGKPYIHRMIRVDNPESIGGENSSKVTCRPIDERAKMESINNIVAALVEATAGQHKGIILEAAERTPNRKYLESFAGSRVNELIESFRANPDTALLEAFVYQKQDELEAAFDSNPMFEAFWSGSQSGSVSSAFKGPVDVELGYLRQFYTVAIASPNRESEKNLYLKYLTAEDIAKMKESLGIKQEENKNKEELLKMYLGKNNNIPPYYLLIPRKNPRDFLRITNKAVLRGYYVVKHRQGGKGGHFGAYFIKDDWKKNMFALG